MKTTPIDSKSSLGRALGMLKTAVYKQTDEQRAERVLGRACSKAERIRRIEGHERVVIDNTSIRR